jgi:VIT1/CCC1 family predicted Fe2+/Mn2+ transporter
MIDNKTKSLWLHHLRDEVDAAFLYRELAALISDEKKIKIYNQLAEIEDKHAKAWRDLLQKENVKTNFEKVSVKARMLAWLSKKFGAGLLAHMLLKEEAAEVKTYLALYNSSPAGVTKNIALHLARDSAEHADRLMRSDGIKSEPWHSSGSGSLLRNIVYGFNDGLTANFGLIAGVIGASAAPHVILISGIAGLTADALSMGSSGYLAATSEKEVFDYERKMEAEEIKHMPELETEELALIYESKGLKSEEAHARAVEAMKNPEQVLEDKVREELGIINKPFTPFKEGWVTGFSTAVGAFIPIFPFFFFEGASAVWISFLISMLAHFAVGAARSFFTGRGIIRSGFDMFVVGFGVAAVGYFIGELIIKFL